MLVIKAKKIDSVNFTKPMEDIEELYKVSDFILLSVPLNSDTKHLINLSSFKLMKKKLFLLMFPEEKLSMKMIFLLLYQKK